MDARSMGLQMETGGTTPVGMANLEIVGSIVELD